MKILDSNLRLIRLLPFDKSGAACLKIENERQLLCVGQMVKKCAKILTLCQTFS